MKTKKLASAQSVFLKELASFWPALKGSLAPVRKPCIRPNCPACARGQKHPAHLLAFTEKGRRRCMYVPIPLVPLLQRAVANGRRIEALLYQMGPALIREYRQNASPTKGRKGSVSSTKTGTSKKSDRRKS